MGYHLTEIPKGVLGEFSKIEEEFLEALDALKQNNNVMLLIELSDLLGAIDAFVNRYNLTLEDLIIMKDATKRAFDDGTRSKFIKHNSLDELFGIEPEETWNKNVQKILKKYGFTYHENDPFGRKEIWEKDEFDFVPSTRLLRFSQGEFSNYCRKVKDSKDLENLILALKPEIIEIKEYKK